MRFKDELVKGLREHIIYASNSFRYISIISNRLTIAVASAG